MTNRNEFQEKDMAKAALLYVQAQAEIDALQARVAELEKALHQVRVLTDVNCDEAFSIVCAALGSKP